MPTGSNAAAAMAEAAPAQALSAEAAADALLANHDGDPRAAVVALIKMVRALKDENRVLRGAASARLCAPARSSSGPRRDRVWRNPAALGSSRFPAACGNGARRRSSSEKKGRP